MMATCSAGMTDGRMKYLKEYFAKFYKEYENIYPCSSNCFKCSGVTNELILDIFNALSYE
jgi:bacterioferritin-associated ferredoxin